MGNPVFIDPFPSPCHNLPQRNLYSKYPMAHSTSATNHEESSHIAVPSARNGGNSFHQNQRQAAQAFWERTSIHQSQQSFPSFHSGRYALATSMAGQHPLRRELQAILMQEHQRQASSTSGTSVSPMRRRRADMEADEDDELGQEEGNDDLGSVHRLELGADPMAYSIRTGAPQSILPVEYLSNSQSTVHESNSRASSRMSSFGDELEASESAQQPAVDTPRTLRWNVSDSESHIDQFIESFILSQIRPDAVNMLDSFRGRPESSRPDETPSPPTRRSPRPVTRPSTNTSLDQQWPTLDAIRQRLSTASLIPAFVPQHAQGGESSIRLVRRESITSLARRLLSSGLISPASTQPSNPSYSTYIRDESSSIERHPDSLPASARSTTRRTSDSHR